MQRVCGFTRVSIRYAPELSRTCSCSLADASGRQSLPSFPHLHDPSLLYSRSLTGDETWKRVFNASLPVEGEEFLEHVVGSELHHRELVQGNTPVSFVTVRLLRSHSLHRVCTADSWLLTFAAHDLGCLPSSVPSRRRHHLQNLFSICSRLAVVSRSRRLL